MKSYAEYQWDILKSIELYHSWNYDDFHWLVEGKPKAVRYMLHVIWDLLDSAEMAEDEKVRKVLLDKALKFFTFVAGEIDDVRLLNLIVERFKVNGKEIDEGDEKNTEGF